MIRMINGTCRIGTELVTPQTGAFSTEKETENRLVSLGVAEYVNGQAAPRGFERENEAGSGGNTSEEKPSENAPQEAESGIPIYNTKMTAKELRAIGEKEGVKFKPRATKEEMVAQLDEYFDAGEVGHISDLNLTPNDIVT